MSWRPEAETFRVSIPAHDEFGTLAEKFNQLSRRIKNDRAQWETERGQFFNIFRSITDALLLLDARGHVLFANTEAQGKLGLPAGGSSDGRPLNLLLGPGPSAEPDDRKCLRNQAAKSATSRWNWEKGPRRLGFWSRYSHWGRDPSRRAVGHRARPRSCSGTGECCQLFAAGWRGWVGSSPASRIRFAIHLMR